MKDDNDITMTNQQRYNEETEIAIKEVHGGKNLVGPFESVDELFKNLNAED